MNFESKVISHYFISICDELTMTVKCQIWTDGYRVNQYNEKKQYINENPQRSLGDLNVLPKIGL